MDLPFRRAGRPVPRVTVGAPLYDEQAVLGEFVRRTLAVLDGLPGGPHGLVLVDDGSADRTAELARAAAAADGRVGLVRLSRNFGHQAALTAALDHADGDVVVLTDGDLQDRPEEIPGMLARWADGADVVYAVRASRKEDRLRRVCYRAFYRVIGQLSEFPLPADAGDFCLLDRAAADALRAAPESHRYLRGLRAWAGFRQVAVPLHRDARHAGETKYSWAKLFALAFDGIFSFSVVPLRIATWFGLATVGLSTALIFLSLAAWVFGRPPEGFTALATSLAFFSGVQVLCLGIVGEYVGRIYAEVKRRPHYVVGERAGFLEKPETPTHRERCGPRASAMKRGAGPEARLDTSPARETASVGRT